VVASQLCRVDQSSLRFVDNFIAMAARTIPPLLPHVVFVASDTMARSAFEARSPAVLHAAMDAPSPFHVALRVLELGFDALVLDPSSLPMRHPLNHLLDVPRCDLAAGLDHADPSRLLVFKGLVDLPGSSERKMDRGHIPSLVWKAEANRLGAGDLPVVVNPRAMLWQRLNGRALVFLRAVVTHLGDDAKRSPADLSAAFNAYLATVFAADVTKDVRLFTADRVRYSGCVELGPVGWHPLSPAFFANAGHLEQLLPQRFAVTPYLVFANLTAVGGA